MGDQVDRFASDAIAEVEGEHVSSVPVNLESLEPRVGAVDGKVARDGGPFPGVLAHNDRARDRARDIVGVRSRIRAAPEPDGVARLDRGGMVQCRLQVPWLSGTAVTA